MAISTDASIQIKTGKTYRTWFGWQGGTDVNYRAQGILSPSNSTFNYNNRGGTSDIYLFCHIINNNSNVNDDRSSFILPDTAYGDFKMSVLSEIDMFSGKARCNLWAMLLKDADHLIEEKNLWINAGESGSIVLKDPNNPKTVVKFDFSIPVLYTKEKMPVSITISGEE